MKLLRYGPPGRREARPAGRGRHDPLPRRPSCATSTGSRCPTPALKMIAGIDPNTLPKVDANARLGSCVARPVNYVCIGLNYADHAAEAGMPVPKEPIIFLKSLGAMCGPNDDVKHAARIEEARLGGRTRHRHRQDRALRAGERRDELRRRLLRLQRRARARVSSSSAPAPGTRARAATRSARPGPWVVTKDEVARSAEPAAVDRGERQADAERHDQDDDLRRGEAGQLCQPLHDAACRRRDRHRHAARRRPGREARTRCSCKAGDTMRLSVEGLGVQTQRVVEG